MATVIDFKHAKKNVRRGAGKRAADHRESTRKSAAGLEGENPDGNTLSLAAPRWGYTMGLWLSAVLAVMSFAEGRWIWGIIHVAFFCWTLQARERIDRVTLGPSPYEQRTGVHPECGYRHTT